MARARVMFSYRVQGQVDAIIASADREVVYTIRSETHNRNTQSKLETSQNDGPYRKREDMTSVGHIDCTVDLENEGKRYASVEWRQDEEIPL